MAEAIPTKIIIMVLNNKTEQYEPLPSIYERYKQNKEGVKWYTIFSTPLSNDSHFYNLFKNRS